MAMRRACGFEAGDLGVVDAYYTTAPTISAVQARSGTYSCLNSGTTQIRFNTNVLGQAEWFIQVGLYITAFNITWGGTTLILYDRVGQNVYVYVNPATGLFTVSRTYANPLGNSAVPILMNQWICLELHVVIDNANGVIQLKQNGALIIDLAGVDTMTDFAEVVAVGIGSDPTAAFRQGFTGYIDDFVANDTTGVYNTSWTQELGLWPVIPEGVGATTLLTPTVGNNWDCVEEAPPNDGDYVYSDVVDNFDTYEATDVGVAGLVRGVVKWVRAREDVGSPRDVAMMWRIDGTDYTGADLGIDVGFAYYNEVEETSPDTGVPFTTTEINNAEIGVKVR